MQTGAVGSSSTSSIGASLAGSGSSVSKEEFLKLLVTQLRLQNPMDPLGNEEFVAQLAQFGALEEMQNVRTATETNTQLMGSVNNAVATSFIGRQAIGASDAFSWSPSDPLDLGVVMPSAGSATVNVYDGANRLVATVDAGSLEAGTTLLSWDGRGLSGETLPAGHYRLEVTATGENGAPVTATPLIAGVVEGVSFSGGATYLSVGGTRVPLSAVVEINE
jgi:flagellar basal-body rod modification protein FlgD